MELIPRYNGTNIPLNTFLDGCREALCVMPEGYEQDFVKLIKTRLFGETAKCVAKKPFYKLDELENFLDTFFACYKTYHELNRDLAKIKQKWDESVVVYLNRVRAIGEEVLAAAIREKRLNRDFFTILDKDLVKFFVKGLHQAIKSRLGQ